MILVSIYKGIERRQSFGQVENAFIRAVDAKGQEMLRYDLSKEEQYSAMHSMIFGEFYRHSGGWKFRAIGTPYETDRFAEILHQRYM